MSLNKRQDEELLSWGIGREVGMGGAFPGNPLKRKETLGPDPWRGSHRERSSYS